MFTMNLFKRELKANFKSFLMWAIILIGMFLAIFLMYPSIVNSDNIQMMDELMKMFPEEVLKAFNMDISSLDTAYGWLKSEGFCIHFVNCGLLQCYPWV